LTKTDGTLPAQIGYLESSLSTPHLTRTSAAETCRRTTFRQ